MESACLGRYGILNSHACWPSIFAFCTYFMKNDAKEEKRKHGEKRRLNGDRDQPICFQWRKENSALKSTSFKVQGGPFCWPSSPNCFSHLLYVDCPPGIDQGWGERKYDLAKACTQNTSLASELWTFKYFKLTSGPCHENGPRSQASSRTSAEAFTKLID